VERRGDGCAYCLTISVFLSVTDPDPHQSEKMDPDPHQSSSRVQNNGVPDAFQLGLKVVQNKNSEMFGTNPLSTVIYHFSKLTECYANNEENG
jgi:hypothetical protein